MTPILNNKYLLNSGKSISIPEYDRTKLKHGIVHIGVGNFHRAHQAVYLDSLLKMGFTDQGIVGINLILPPQPISQIFAQQDGLYTLSSFNSSGDEICTAIGSIIGYIDAPWHMEQALTKASIDQTKLITLTITEKGYCIDQNNDGLDWNHPAIAHDLDDLTNPVSAIGFLASALYRRYIKSKKPLTILSCDNIPSNGTTLRKQVNSFCRELYPSMIPWLEEQVAFPCSMVDRITPITTNRDIDRIKERHNVFDQWPVHCESFKQWVIEYSFNTSIPDFSHAGAQIVANVEPYEEMKIRLLNGSHSALAYLAHLLDYDEVADAIKDEDLSNFVRNRYMEQVSNTLGPIKGIDLKSYKDSLIERFGNVHIGDKILRLASDGSKKIPIAIIRPLLNAAEAGKDFSAIIFALAGWARFLAGVDEHGNSIVIDDPQSEQLKIAALRAKSNPEEFLFQIGIDIFNTSYHKEIIRLFSEFLNSLYNRGTRITLSEYLQDNRYINR